MNIIVPVFPKNNLEKELLWAKIGGQPFILFALKQLCKLQEARLFVFTDQERIIHYLRSLNIQYDFIHRDISNDLPEIFPPGTSVTMKCLFKSHKMSKDEDLILVDYRNPLIIPDLVRKAYREYVKSRKAVLLSATEVGDHPAQLDAYYRIIDVDIVILVDDGDDWFQSLLGVVEKRLPGDEIRTNITLCNMAVSKPFFFDWQSYDCSTGTTMNIYGRICNGYNWRMVPLEKLHQTIESTSGSSVSWYYFEKPDAARRLIDRSLLVTDGEGQIAALPFLRDLGSVEYMLIKSTPQTPVHLYMKKAFINSNALLRIWPICDNTVITGSAEDYYLSRKDLNKKSRFTFLDSTFVGPVGSLEQAHGIYGYVVAILKRVSENVADFAEPFKTREELWQVDPVTKVRTDRVTGESILGRQDLPEVFKADGSLIIFHMEDIDHFEEMILDGKSEGLVLDSSRSCRIESQMDLLQLKAQLRASNLSIC